MADVKLKPGWIVKGVSGWLFWCSDPVRWLPEHKTWVSTGKSMSAWASVTDCIVDPWPDKPDGGPECILEVK